MIAFAFIGNDGHPTRGGTARALPEGAVVLPAPFTTADLPRLQYRDGVWVERIDLAQPFALTPEEVAAEQAAMAEGLLSRARAQAVENINRRTGDFRKRVYTDIAAQAGIYMDKRAEAVAYVAAVEHGSEPETLADYPYLEGEVGVTAPTAWQLAQIWLHRNDTFSVLGSATESVRRRAIVAVETAPDFDTIETIEAAFTEALNSLPL